MPTVHRPSVIEDFQRHSVCPPSPASWFNGACRLPSLMCALPLELVPQHLLGAAELMSPSSGHLIDGSLIVPFSRRHLRAPVSAAPLRCHLRPMAVGAPMLARHVRLESVALTGKTLPVVGCRPLTGGLATSAAESAHRTPEPHPCARSGQRCGRALVGRPTPGQAKRAAPGRT
jgi:hypothetical protein